MQVQVDEKKLNEVEANSSNWLSLYKQYLNDGYHVRLKLKTINNKTNLSIVYWEDDNK